MRLVMLTLLIGCADKGGEDSSVDLPVCESPGPQDDSLRLNDAQALGTHNSYHVQPDSPLDASWAYTMPSLTEQLADYGVRQVELDVHHHVDLGWQVFHVPNVDDGTTCTQLSDCLGELERWSEANPCHLPLTVWIEPKDDIDAATDDYQSLSGRWDDLEDTILATVPAARIYSPDDLRGDAATLPEALSDHGWPTLGELRGKFLFALLDSSDYRGEYLDGAPAAEGRLMFPMSDDDDEGDSYAAVYKIDDPVSGYDAIRARVEDGFLVTCTADEVGGTDEDNANGLDMALSAACHAISTNALTALPDTTYVASIPGGTPARCNPVSAPTDCTAEAVESLP